LSFFKSAANLGSLCKLFSSGSTFRQAEQIRDRFCELNPYRRDVVPGSILKIEDDNYDPSTEKQRRLHCLAISAKRYALFKIDAKGNPNLLRNEINNRADRWSEHGLGHLLNPTDPASEDREWIAQAWLRIVRKSMELKTGTLNFEDFPAVGRLSISSPSVLKPLQELNIGKRYSDQIKPFNFLLSCHVNPFGNPTGTDPERFHLVSPFELNSKEWLERDWIDQYSGHLYGITTKAHFGSRSIASVKTYGDILTEYEFHSESKCADSQGSTCSKQTIGLLQRRHVQIELVKYIGKESNSLEDVTSGIVHSDRSVYTEYSDPRRDEWIVKIQPALKNARLDVLVKACGKKLSRREIIELRAARSKPHRGTEKLLAEILKKLGRL
jgi:hypothetical protein